MSKNKINKIIAISLFFTFVFFLANFAITKIKDEKRDYYLEVQNNLLHTKYDTVHRYFKIMSQDIYAMYSQNEELLKLLQEAKTTDPAVVDITRKKVYKLLIKNYLRLSNMGISQVHFHTQDNKSFLRMYAPDEFGDDLTALRTSVVLANKTLQPQEGFESCRFITGLRFVYPLFTKDKEHVGSFEITFSAAQLLKSITDDFVYDSHILVSKSIANHSVIQKEYLTTYRDTWETNLYYIEESSHKKINDKNIYQEIATPQLKKKIDIGIRTEEPFTLVTLYNYQNIIMTFLHVASANGIKNIAYIVTYTESDYLSNIQIEENYLKLLLLVVLFLLYLFTIYAMINREKLKELALYDPLTKLPNRILFAIELQDEINRAERYKQNIALMFIDLDGFKAVNDTYGHQVGDELLKKTAKILQSTTRKVDIASRVGGDEFTVILPDITNAQEALNIANELIKEISAEMLIGHKIIKIGASIGIAMYPEHSKDKDVLIKFSDKMMYKAKSSGKNQVFLFSNKEKNTNV